MAKPTSPLEEREQADFVEWLEYQGLKFTAIPNSTFTNSWSQKRKNYLTGLRAGFPDMVILIPPDRSKDGEGYLIPIEMKRRSGGVVSKEQKEWVEAINGLGLLNVQAYVCKGAAEATKIIGGYAKLRAISPF